MPGNEMDKTPKPDAELDDAELDTLTGGATTFTTGAEEPAAERKQMLTWYKAMQESGKSD